MGRPRLDLVGQQFGDLVVLRPGETRGRATLWWCRCSCGSEYEYYTANLRGGLSTRCRDCAGADPPNLDHGMSKTPEWHVWRRVVRSGECCARWQSFVNFLADVGKRPSSQHAFERVDKDRAYSPSNARWMLPHEWNRRTAKQVTFEGRTQSLNDWARELGISRQALDERIRRHGLEGALSRRRVGQR